MPIYLVQHGKNLPKEMDPDKGLSQLGVEEVEQVAEKAKRSGIAVSSIRHSGKKRARQTADIFGEALKPEGGVAEMKGLAPMDDVKSAASSLDPDEPVMLVGHLPFMEKLASYLVAGSADRPVVAFRNGGIVCLDKHPEQETWVLLWTLLPDVG